MIDRYAVVGNPVAHSKSPLIHASFAEQTGQQLIYEAILAPEDGFEDTVRLFIGEGGRGVNVTLPFKLRAQAFVDRCSERAERARAVNTIAVREDGSTFGENTDGIGLLRDLATNHNVALQGRRVLILGAGGAVRGVLEPLLSAGPYGIVIANRTVPRALELAREFSDLGEVAGCGFPDLKGEQFDLIINATSTGIDGTVPPIPDDVLRLGGCCYDMFYAPEPTAFVLWGLTHGADKSLDGMGMLVEQAAESFYLWRGIRPDTEPVINALQNG